jgi:hypothetical protein
MKREFRWAKHSEFFSPQCFWYFLHKKYITFLKKSFMDLKQFVVTALTEIDGALEKATTDSKKYRYTYWNNVWWNPTIDFEVQVYATEWIWKKEWIWINVAWIKLWTKWESNSTNHEQSVIKFSVERKNTPEQENEVNEEKWKYHAQTSYWIGSNEIRPKIF